MQDRVARVGSDGRLVWTGESVAHVTLFEKLLVPALSKLSNWVPGGGIWMNTQRPEWNDANNALAGNGVSMVTAYYLRRYLTFLVDLWTASDVESVVVSTEVATWLRAVSAAFESRPQPTDDVARRAMLDRLGRAFEAYRDPVYARGFSGREAVPVAEAVEAFTRALHHLDATIEVSHRDDGLFHAYNLLDLRDDRAVVTHLYEMLEGQVAALSSGAVSAADTVRLVDEMFESALYRPDQDTFLLYPARRLPGFLDKNVIPDARAAGVVLIRELLDAGQTAIVERDVDGTVRFHADFANADDLDDALTRLSADPTWTAAVDRDRAEVMDVYEEVFRHHGVYRTLRYDVRI